MLRLNVGLLFGGCAAVSVGIVGGWAAPTLMMTRTPAVERPAEALSTQPPRTPPPPANESQAASPILASPIPPTSTKEAPAIRERNPAASGPTGVWIDHTGRGAVEITECAGALCGRIVWLKDAGNRSVCGKQIIGSAKRTSAGTWDGGWIYDPDREERYSVELKLFAPDKLRVIGYMGSKLFSESYTWKRATVDLTRCDTTPITASPSLAAGDPKPAVTATTQPETPPGQPPETPSARRDHKSGSAIMADLETIAREMMKGKPNGKGCTVTLPYVGTVDIPCRG
jgi:uncharacterized protein (DUF2147 family)